MERINKSLPNYAIWNISRLNADAFNQLPDPQAKLTYLAQIGHLAPSTHNTQPWAFKVNIPDFALEIYLVSERVLPISDVKSRQAFISMGCAIANIEMAAAYLNGISKMDIFDFEHFELHSQAQHLIAKIYLNQDALPDPSLENLYMALFDRRIDRGEMDPDRNIDDDIMKQAQSWNTKDIYANFISDWGRKNALAELQSMADSFVINNKKFCEELVNDWLIENDSHSGLGMPGDTFYMNDEQTRNIKMKSQNHQGFEAADIAGIISLGKRGILSADKIGIIQVSKDNIHSWIISGILLEKIWCLFESNNIAVAIHAGLAEVKEVNSFLLRPILLSLHRPVILFRAGYLKNYEKKAHHSPRLHIKDVINDFSE